jgi:hypothetical protein
VGFISELHLFQIVTTTATAGDLNSLLQAIQSNRPTFLVGVTRNYYLDVPQANPYLTDLQNLVFRNGDPRLATAYASVGVPQTWDLLRAMSNIHTTDVTIGIVDSGIDRTHPEFSTGVNFGTTPVTALQDSQGCTTLFLVPLRCGHGTQVAGIIGANNLSDPDPGAYKPGQMNGILSGIPGYFFPDGRSRYILEERNWRNIPTDIQMLSGKHSASMYAQLFFTGQLIRLGVKVILLEFAALTDLTSVENVRLWFKLINNHPDRLFILPAGNYRKGVDSVTTIADAEFCIEIPGCINLPHTITVGALNPFVAESDVGYRAQWPDPVEVGSDFGGAVEIAASGSYVYTPQAGGSLRPYSDPINNITFNGTSAAAPFVAGAAAMLLAVAPQQLSSTDLKRILTKPITEGGSADVLPGNLGIGNRLNVCRAVLKTVGPPAPKLSSPINNDVLPAVAFGSGLVYNVPLNWSDVSSVACNAPIGYEVAVMLNGQPFGGGSVQSPGFHLIITNPTNLSGWTWTVTAVDPFDNRKTSATGTFSLQPTPQIGVTPSSWDFGSITLGSSAQTRFVISNTGNSTLAVSNITVNLSDFVLGLPSPLPFNLLPGSSAILNVKFQPSVAGLRQGTVTIATLNALSGNALISLTGTGAASGASPTCSLYANASLITAGQSSTLIWTTTDTPTSASIAPGIGPVNVSLGSISVSPMASATYTLTVSNDAGAGTCQATVTIGTVSCNAAVCDPSQDPRQCTACPACGGNPACRAVELCNRFNFVGGKPGPVYTQCLNNATDALLSFLAYLSLKYADPRSNIVNLPVLFLIAGDGQCNNQTIQDPLTCGGIPVEACYNDPDCGPCPTIANISDTNIAAGTCIPNLCSGVACTLGACGTAAACQYNCGSAHYGGTTGFASQSIGVDFLLPGPDPSAAVCRAISQLSATTCTPGINFTSYGLDAGPGTLHVGVGTRNGAFTAIPDTAGTPTACPVN